LPVATSQIFRSLQFDDVRAWALSAAPAATVALGATFSPAHWSFVPFSGQSPSALCPWGCGELQVLGPYLLVVSVSSFARTVSSVVSVTGQIRL